MEVIAPVGQVHDFERVVDVRIVAVTNGESRSEPMVAGGNNFYVVRLLRAGWLADALT